MAFLTDKQTIKDLNITGKFNKDSVFSIFNKTVTKGGEKVLEKMFSNPLAQTGEINKRVSVFQFFEKSGIAFPLSRNELQTVEEYLLETANKSFIASFFYMFKKKAMKLIANEKEFEIIQSGFRATLLMLSKVNEFVIELEKFPGNIFTRENKYLTNLFEIKELKYLIGRVSKMEGFSFLELCRYNHLLRYSRSSEMVSLVKLIHKLDVYTSVAHYAKSRGFTYAKADGSKSTRDNNSFEINIEGVFHPGLEKAVANDISLNQTNNLLFLTGANMAGKSTLMKSFSIAVYLAQMGFPVAAKKMNFTPMEGLFTSINVPDNIDMGYSHFYAEVMRVKMIAREVAAGKRMVVLFDEMFKGTNVKDAFDATVCISECFTKKQKCAFVVSTHIMEAAIALQKKCNGIMYKYLPSTFNNGMLEYSYLLQDGISDDHFGMVIVNKEKIIETIKQSPCYESYCAD